MERIGFHEYVLRREGMWMPDSAAVVGLSRLPPPKPPAKMQQKPERLKPFKRPPGPPIPIQPRPLFHY